jgi:U3 small nucleolar RNA-associated protein 12
MLLELPGHHGEVWALAVSTYGDFIVSGSHDRSIRRWDRTTEPFFVEEEKEKRLESLFEADLEQQQAQIEREAAAAGVSTADGGAAAAPAGRRTLESVGAADSIVDALDVAANEERKEAEYKLAVEEAVAAAAAGGKKAAARARAGVKRPPINPLMLGLPPGSYVLRTVSGVRSSDLEQALLLLPFADALRLMRYVSDWLEQNAHVELCCRAAALLLRLHHAQLVATPAARGVLVALQRRLRAAARGLKDTLGFNVAALRHLRRAGEEAAGVAGGDSVAAARRQLLGGGGGGEV